MSKRTPTHQPTRTTPKVRIARPSGRPYQLRYFCPYKGHEVRISVGCRDESAAEILKRELEAKLLLGIEPRARQKTDNEEMAWDDFREQFRVHHLATLRGSTAMHAESRLDLAERILRPKYLKEAAEPHALQQLQSKLLSGSASLRSKPRSIHTVRGYMNSILASLNWAFLQGWLPVAPKIRKLRASRQKVMKGRPITEDEFKRMLAVVSTVVGEEAADTWSRVLWGLWTSALRLDELMHVHWSQMGTIRPVWLPNERPILEIPAAMQKNDTDQRIPLLPWFEQLLLSIPESDRNGWVFNPQSLQKNVGRNTQNRRPQAHWVGKIIGRIGKAAGIEVEPADERTGRPTKYASAHDLRRSCGERLRNAGVPPLVISRVMRHSSWETTQKHYAPGNIQSDAAVLNNVLNREKGA